MTKAVLCLNCSDIFAPYRDWETNRSWRWCQCGSTGGRWVDGVRGLLEVTCLYERPQVRVLGLSNMFLEAAVRTAPTAAAVEWRRLHEACANLVEPHYLFHEDRRACWALVVRPNESGDVTFVDWDAAHLPVDDTPAG